MAPLGIAVAVYVSSFAVANATGEDAYLRVGSALAISFFLVGQMISRVRTPVRTADFRLLENPDDPDVCLVEASIVVDYLTIGRDRGVGWFEDGRLLFSGHRTSFALGGEDVASEDRWRALHQGAQHLPLFLVPIDDPQRFIYVSFRFLRGGDGIAMRQEMNFVRRLEEFRRSRPRSNGARQLPPFDR